MLAQCPRSRLPRHLSGIVKVHAGGGVEVALDRDASFIDVNFLSRTRCTNVHFPRIRC